MRSWVIYKDDPLWELDYYMDVLVLRSHVYSFDLHIMYLESGLGGFSLWRTYA